MHEYTEEEVKKIISSGSLREARELSRNFFQKDGFYRKLVMYYATLYLYNGILIPNPSPNADLSQKAVQKRYRNACRFIDKIDLKGILTKCAVEAIVSGCYYGAIQTLDKDRLAILDLPPNYCRSRYKNKQGIDLIEFDVKFFDTITDLTLRETMLKVYPEKISRWYLDYKQGKTPSHWVFVPDELCVCFPLYDERPLLLSSIKASMDYGETVELEKARDWDEIRKIVTLQIPHLADGSLLFEPDEALVMHKGVVNMLKDNPNVSVLTTYATPDAITSRTTSEASRSNLEKMMKNIYSEAGVSGQIFSADSNLAIETSISNDMACISPLIEKFNLFVSEMINRVYGNSSMSFHYTILPVTWYNQTKYAETAFNFATSGYSYLMPAVAMGISQSDLTNLKDLENTILQLEDKLRPLGSAYTASAAGNGEAGAPKKEGAETSPKTEQNQISLEKQGGSSN